MRTIKWAALLCATLALAACDVIRVPGDGRTPPDPRPVIPPGAPGPPPPMVPVDDPWGEEGETPTVPDTDTETPPVEDDEPVVSPPPPPPPLPIKFEYYGPGDLISGTGAGLIDDTIYAPDMLFPIRTAPTRPQSMVYRPGGAVGGDQCDATNYTIAWRDNFCEKRSKTRNTPLCPTNKVHQGQDLRVGTAADCLTLRSQPKSERGIHEAIAVEDGIIQHIGTYSVQLKGTETGNLYSYLHLNMQRLDVAALQVVSAGDRIGFISNDFGSTPTTFHLHFEIKAAVEGQGIIHVPPYTSLVAAYERREEGRGELVEDDTVAIASVLIIVDETLLVE